MRVEWWYDDASFHLDKTKVYLACLTVRDDGTAQLRADGEDFEFPSGEEASTWLTSEEYSLLDILIEDFHERGLPVDPRLNAYAVDSGNGRSLPLVLDLAAANGSVLPNRQGSSSAKT